MHYIVKRLFVESEFKERNIALNDHQTIANGDFDVHIIKDFVTFIALKIFLVEGYTKVDYFCLVGINFLCFLDVYSLDIGMHARIFTELDQYLKTFQTNVTFVDLYLLDLLTGVDVFDSKFRVDQDHLSLYPFSFS